MMSSKNCMNYSFAVWVLIFSCSLVNIVFGQEYVFTPRKYKNCSDSSFCMRLRAQKPNESPFQFLMDSVKVMDSQSLVGKLVNSQTKNVYDFTVESLEQSTFRFQMKEETVYRPRFHPDIGLAGTPSPQKFKLIEKSDHKVVVETDTVHFKLIGAPARIELYHIYDKTVPALVVNDVGTMTMEYSQAGKGLLEYQEEFDGFVDTRPYGPMAVGLDFSFPKASHMYGLPMHLETLTLQSSKDSNPYRLYNVDFGDQKPHDKRSMYGSVPFAIGHGVNSTAGVFWYNTADTWVDVKKPNETSSVNHNIHFMSETGALDAFLFLGPTFYEVTQQYVVITGKAPLPPYFSLGYHQCKWNYFTQEEVMEVADNFDKHNFPLDVMWLDIEYTDHKKYFTWDPINFSRPLDMINALAAKNRKLVVIIDPHIKRDPEYKVYKRAIEKGLFVNRNNGSVFYADCWPKDSAWLDFVNPETCEFWSQQFLLENFQNTTEDVFIWNDMNEPSVFKGAESTLPKDVVHHGGWEHRDVHNVYGLLEVSGTYEGLLRRSDGKKRPFILTRSYYSGIQRYSAIWLGDNYATFQSMKNSIAMCLTAALSGISFCGADVGGFTGLPETELLVRWYQLGAFIPFYREHSNLGVPGHEPYRQDEHSAKQIREALQDRQILLPFWYTIFYANSVTGKPVLRPLVLEFPDEVATFDIDYEYLIGDAVLVRPLTEPKVTEAGVYFPGGENELWYPYIPAFEAQRSGKRVFQLTASYNTTLVFIRGGQIITKCADAQNKPLPTAKQVLDSDISLYIAPSKKDTAAGFLYIDDGETFAYKSKNFSTFNFEYDTNKLNVRFADDNNYLVQQSVTQIEIAGEKRIKKAVANVAGSQVELTVVSQPHITLLTAKKGQLPLSKEWSVTFE